MSIKNEIAELIKPAIESEGFDLVEIKLALYKANSRLQIFIDSDNGVTIDDCANVSRILEPMIDAANMFKYGYTIEISSPGLDRPLSTARDVRRRVGEKVEIFFNDSSIPPLRGDLVGANDRYIELETKNGRDKLDLFNVRVGKIIF